MSNINSLLNDAKQLRPITPNDLINYFLTSFIHKSSVDNNDILLIGNQHSLLLPIKNSIMEITNRPLQIMANSKETKVPGQETQNFFYKESHKTYGMFDIDYMWGKLANFRCQYYITGFFVKGKLNQAYNDIHNNIFNKYGDGKYIAQADALVWFDNNADIVITLRQGIQPAWISTAIIDRKYSGL